jgi:hypothetical protein
MHVNAVLTRPLGNDTSTSIASASRFPSSKTLHRIDRERPAISILEGFSAGASRPSKRAA